MENQTKMDRWWVFIVFPLLLFGTIGMTVLMVSGFCLFVMIKLNSGKQQEKKTIKRAEEGKIKRQRKKLLNNFKSTNKNNKSKLYRLFDGKNNKG